MGLLDDEPSPFRRLTGGLLDPEPSSPGLGLLHEPSARGVGLLPADIVERRNQIHAALADLLAQGQRYGLQAGNALNGWANDAWQAARPFVPPEIRGLGNWGDGTPLPLASMARAMTPVAGELDSSADAVEASRRLIADALSGNLGGAASRAAETVTGVAGAIPVMGGMMRVVKRAAELPTVFRGDRAAVREFGLSRDAKEPAVFFTNSPQEAGAFGEKVYRTKIDPDAFHTVNARGEVYDPALMQGWIAEAKQAGAPGLVVRNIQNFEHGPRSTTYAVFEPVPFGPPR